MKDNRKDERISNFYYLLAYAFDDEKIHFKEHQNFETEKFTTIYDSFAIVIDMRMKEIMQAGLYKQYISYNEELSAIKGRIDIIKTIRKNTLKTKQKIICNYDDYSENNLLNQIVKTTIYMLLKMRLMEQNMRKLRRLIFNMENVDIIKNIRGVRWNSIKFNKLNNRYKTLIKICEFILKKIIINQNNGKEKIEAFDDDEELNELFEKFIRNYLNRYYVDICKKKNKMAKIEQLEWNEDENYEQRKNVNLIPKMHTDVTIKYKDKIEIIDAKFYAKIFNYKGYNGSEKKTLQSEHWYQLYAYVTNTKEKYKKENKNVSGMLLYAKTEEENVDVDCIIMGNRMRAKTLDFTQKFGNPYKSEKGTISYEMNKIAKEILN